MTGLVEDDGRVVGVETTSGELRAPLVVGADGARSTVARLVGASEYHRTPPGGIFLWGYLEGVPAENDGVWLGKVGEYGFLASPTDAGLFMAAVVLPIDRREELRRDRATAYAGAFAHWPELEASLAGARRVGPIRMMSRWHGFFRESAGPGWVLVGDAGHFKDPTPGQGISDALRQAVELAPRDRAGPRRRSSMPTRPSTTGGRGGTGTPGRCTGSLTTWVRPVRHRSWYGKFSVASGPTRSSPKACYVS